MKSEDCKVHLEDKWASENEKLQEKNKKLRDEKAALVRELERMEKERLQSGESLKHEMEICQEHVAQTEELKNQLESCGENAFLFMNNAAAGRPIACWIFFYDAIMQACKLSYQDEIRNHANGSRVKTKHRTSSIS